MSPALATPSFRVAMMSAPLRLLVIAALAVGSSAAAFELVIPPESEAPAPAAGVLSESLQNGGFEESAEQGAPPSAWTTFGATGGVLPNVAVAMDTVRGGRASLRLAGGADGVTQSGATQRVAVNAGDWVQLDAWALVPMDDPLEEDGRHATLSITFHGGEAEGDGRAARSLPGSNSKRIADTASPVSTWVRRRFVLRVPDGATEARVTLAFYQPRSGLGSVRVDDVTLAVVPPPVTNELPGDFNRDGRVDAADFTVWRDASSGLMPPEFTAKADANGDGVADEADRKIWEANVGRTAAPEE